MESLEKINKIKQIVFDETISDKEKMSKIRKGFDSEARKLARSKMVEKKKIKIIAIDLDTKDEYIFNSLTEASRYTLVDSGNISRIITNKKKKYKNWTFKRYDQN